MRRVLIIGNAGTGKSTFARKLAEKTGLPLVHLDKLFWNGSWEHVSREEFDGALQQELEKDAWIIDGNYNRSLPKRLEYCDTVFFFDLPAVSCMWGATKRVLQNYGRTRADMGGSCPEKFDRNKWELLGMILKFNRNHRKNYYALLKDRKNVVVFRSRKQAARYLKRYEECEV